MKTRALAVAVLLAGLLPVALPPAGAANADVPWTVIAVVDTGINPYHVEFGAASFPLPGADFAQHPSTYLSNYPASAAALDLFVGAPSGIPWSQLVETDRGDWDGAQKGRLYWIPGTKIVGAYDAGDDGFGLADPTPILDDDGHGTAVASIAAGNTLGLCARCLLVVVEDPDGLPWALEQPWIDVVVNSWGAFANLGLPNQDERFQAFDLHFKTRRAAECGQTVLFASGNGVENQFVVPMQTYLGNDVGPAWVWRVGAFATKSHGGEEYPIFSVGKPFDVLGDGADVMVAGYRVRQNPSGGGAEFLLGGTSAAAPAAAGVLGATLQRARERLGDLTEGRGPCDGADRQVLARGAAIGGGGPLADGALTRGELWKAVQHAARPLNFRGVYAFPIGVGLELLTPANEGWGKVDATTTTTAYGYLLNGIPNRSDAAPFFEVDGGVRDALWGPWDKDGDGDRESAPPAPAWSSPLA